MSPQEINWKEVASVFLHPLKIQTLEALAASAKPLSAKKLSDQLGEPPGNVSHHVKMLREAGLIVKVKAKPRRGAVEIFYRLKAGE